MKRRVRKKLTKTLLSVTDGVIGTLTDFTLLSLFSFASTITSNKKTMYDVLFGPNEVSMWHEQLNYQTIKRALYKLTEEGLIQRLKKRDSMSVEITTIGKQRIASLIPAYHTKRPWDGHLYLISYDVSAKHNRERNMLRQYIKKTGGAFLQNSLWLNPYNPTILLSEFSKTNGIRGSILVSKLGKDGSIGEEKLQDLLNRVYRLEELSDRYDAFIEKFSKYTGVQLTVLFSYMAILQDDPQIPFSLLPRDFSGSEAHEVFRSYFPKVYYPN